MKFIRVEGTTEVPHLILNRPNQANALNARLMEELIAALEAGLKAGARAVVLTGAGPGFSAGADLNELSGTGQDFTVDDRIAALTNAILSAPVPIVAALHGFCFGGAVDVAWSCDLVIATPATRIALPATRLGLLYNPPALHRLHARLGSHTLRRLVLFGEELTGQEAWRVAAVDLLAHPDQIWQTATSAASSATRGVPSAVAASKAFFNAILGATDVDFEVWNQRRHDLLASTERQAVVQAHKENKKK